MYRQVQELEIVGYANVLNETMLPVVVPPVFRLKADPTRVFLPPYSFNADLLCNATEVDAQEMVALEAAGELTLFEQPFPAQPGFELWIDQSRQPHYEPRSQADQTLLSIAKASIQQAQAALREGNLVEAERLSGIALSADDRLVEPLAVKAAVCRLQKDRIGEKVIHKLASEAMTEAAFEALVGHYASLAPKRRARRQRPPTTPTAGSIPSGPMHGIAALKAA